MDISVLVLVSPASSFGMTSFPFSLPSSRLATSPDTHFSSAFDHPLPYFATSWTLYNAVPSSCSPNPWWTTLVVPSSACHKSLPWVPSSNLSSIHHTLHQVYIDCLWQPSTYIWCPQWILSPPTCTLPEPHTSCEHHYHLPSSMFSTYSYTRRNWLALYLAKTEVLRICSH